MVVALSALDSTVFFGTERLCIHHTLTLDIPRISLFGGIFWTYISFSFLSSCRLYFCIYTFTLSHYHQLLPSLDVFYITNQELSLPEPKSPTFDRDVTSLNKCVAPVHETPVCLNFRITSLVQHFTMTGERCHDSFHGAVPDHSHLTLNVSKVRVNGVKAPRNSQGRNDAFPASNELRRASYDGMGGGSIGPDAGRPGSHLAPMRDKLWAPHSVRTLGQKQ